MSGNIPTPVKADNFVRIDDPDEPNLEPVGNAGLINIPDFRFGEVEVKPFAQTKGLDASAYQSGYHPYIRFMDNESTGGWSLSAKLGQFTSGSKTLPTTTTLKLRNGVLMDVQNYNKHNESLNYVDLTGSINIPSDSSTVALTDDTNQGVYHLEYDISNVELDLMAHSGIAGLSYQADMDWTLTTAP
ncbi:WxL domain-containing protein [Enterococcus malodoratus]|uniref:WxL domain-containing protein n=1 Tax=Enterococcus malodoratus TaxID=71451 RepID=UPI00207401AA|nr:WxL domain-containing protein [Enterococcus malodoratus]